MPEAKKSKTADSIANTFEWIITAFVLAFVFRAFVLEAFRIPTGSMADTLMGDHFRLRCTQCGFKYEYNFDPYVELNPNNKAYIGNGYYKMLPSPRCPSCGYFENPTVAASKSNGDRILVFKSLYQFTEPKRWDVFVFKNPPDPKINYIKRLIGKPGETIEIIDGDVYVDGKIARKPQKVQEELWFPIYNNNFQPIQPLEGRFNGHGWHQPFTNQGDSQWKWDSARPLEFTLTGDNDKMHTLSYDTKKGNDFRATYAYGKPVEYHSIPYCSDLMLKLAVKKTDKSIIGISLSKYKTTYNASFDSQGTMKIEKISDGNTVELETKQITVKNADEFIPVSFSDSDHLLVFEVAGQKISYDLGTEPNDAGERLAEISPSASIFGSGQLTINDVQLYRDIFYMNNTTRGLNDKILRAGDGEPFTLGEDEFFACGDNSPDSYDSRLWQTEGIGNNGKTYRMGIVPRDYLVGKAFFVYWPGGFRPGNFKLAIIPNVGRMRFIYGGR
ncbi:MAG: signal peptidase I [Planctomycetes bacterium GWF2_42_9]|nr:MAG: signal peptidase I [Planctomycetes bacterium GWF2_42_9]